MRIEVNLRVVSDDGEILCDDATMLAIVKRHDRLEAIGLSLDEGKDLLTGRAATPRCGPGRGLRRRKPVL